MLTALALFALPVAAVVVQVRHSGRRPGAGPVPVIPIAAHLPGQAPSSGEIGTAVLLLAAVVAMTAVAAVMLWLRHRQRAGAAVSGQAGSPSPLVMR
ncbi:MAG TPA: hypothetical protein DHU96_18150 [Actinobacteria bacterium]|nr:hypothetical protein [Actinomycetota bacterium]